MGFRDIEKESGEPLRPIDDERLAEKFIEGLERSGSVRIACMYAGISYQKYLEYMRLGREAIANDIDDEFAQFYSLASATTAEKYMYFVEKLETCEPKRIQAYKFLLDKMIPEIKTDEGEEEKPQLPQGNTYQMIISCLSNQGLLKMLLNHDQDGTFHRNIKEIAGTLQSGEPVDLSDLLSAESESEAGKETG